MCELHHATASEAVDNTHTSWLREDLVDSNKGVVAARILLHNVMAAAITNAVGQSVAKPIFAHADEETARISIRVNKAAKQNR